MSFGAGGRGESLLAKGKAGLGVIPSPRRKAGKTGKTRTNVAPGKLVAPRGVKPIGAGICSWAALDINSQIHLKCFQGKRLELVCQGLAHISILSREPTSSERLSLGKHDAKESRRSALPGEIKEEN